MELRPHDLLRLKSTGALDAEDAPGWVAGSLSAAPWVVVRRALCDAGRIAVGVRGATRSERFAAFVAPDDVAERLAPEDFAHRGAHRKHPVFDALMTLRPPFDATGLAWGPAGGAGFELATGRSVLTATSDLDLIVRLEAPHQLTALRGIAGALAPSAVRIDVVVETAQGGFALGDFLQAGDQVLLRTAQGPRLVEKAALLGGLAA